MAKLRAHNEYFRSVSMGGRKSCPCCGERLDPGEKIWSWGEYVRVQWRTVTHFCAKCFDRKVKDRLNGHTGTCGCTVTLVGYHGEKLPAWLNLAEDCKAA